MENIDDETDDYGILMVKLNDPALAKRYGIKTFPSLVYFRNGNPLTFDGKNKNIFYIIFKICNYLDLFFWETFRNKNAISKDYYFPLIDLHENSDFANS